MDKIEVISKDVTQIKGKVDLMYNAITGDEKLGMKGIVHTQQEHDTRITVLEKKDKDNQNAKSKKEGARLAFAGIAGFLGGSGIKALLIKLGFLLP